jgi:streptogramin lyase
MISVDRVRMLILPAAIVLLAAAFHHSVRQNGGNPPNWRIFPISQSSGIAKDIAVGPDGAIWASSSTPPGLLRVTMTGATSLVSLPFVVPGALTSGSDGRLWVTDVIGGGAFDIAAYDLRTHVLTAYLASGRSGDAILTNSGLVSAGGWMWFCEEFHIGAMLVSGHGSVREILYPHAPSGSGFGGPWMTVGRDGTVWYSDAPGMGSVDPRTGKTQYVDLPVEVRECPPFLTTGADGAIYAFECGYFERIDPRSGKGRAWGPFSTNVYGMAAAPDGNVYFAPGYPPALGEFNPRLGALVWNYSPDGDGASAVTAGPDGNVWSVLGPHWAMGAFILNELNVSPSSVALGSGGQTATLTASYTGPGSLRARSSNAAIVTVRQSGKDMFIVTAQANGDATVTVRDGLGNSFAVPVMVGGS